jgi:hypothetical protein
MATNSIISVSAYAGGYLWRALEGDRPQDCEGFLPKNWSRNLIVEAS